MIQSSTVALQPLVGLGLPQDCLLYTSPSYLIVIVVSWFFLCHHFDWHHYYYCFLLYNICSSLFLGFLLTGSIGLLDLLYNHYLILFFLVIIIITITVLTPLLWVHSSIIIYLCSFHAWYTHCKYLMGLVPLNYYDMLLIFWCSKYRGYMSRYNIYSLYIWIINDNWKVFG